jgi:hypothetical protein
MEQRLDCDHLWTRDYYLLCFPSPAGGGERTMEQRLACDQLSTCEQVAM